MNATLKVDPVYEYRRIGDYYKEMAEIMAWPNERLFSKVDNVSSWSIAEQIVHISMAHSGMFRSIGKIMSTKELPTEATALPPTSPIHTALNPGAVEALRQDTFPRNRFQAPDIVAPAPDTDMNELRKWVRVSRMAYDRMASLAPTLPELSSFIPHPILGPLDARAWLRTIRIHGEHHLGIIRDIDSATR